MKRLVIGLLSLLLFHAVLSWDFQTFSSLLRPQPETWIFALLAGLAAYRSGRVAWLIAFLLGTWTALLFLFRLGDFALYQFFGRPLDLKYDIWMIPNLRDLVVHTVGTAGAWGILLLALAVFISFTALLSLLVKGTGAALHYRPVLLAWLILPLPVLLLQGSRPLSSQSGRLLTAVSEAYLFSRDMDAVETAIMQAYGRQSTLPTDLGHARGTDFLVFFVESYGRNVWSAPDYREAILPQMLPLVRELEEDGYLLATRFVRSPVLGGGSWFAHTTFLTGVPCDNNILWERILESPVRPLSGYFRDIGHRTVSVMPAMKIEEWLEGRYFEFEKDLWFHEMDYPHHGYHWSPMPDQFALARFDEMILQQTGQPVFAELILTSSHAPFAVVPPFHEGEWSAEAILKTLRTQPMRRFDNDYHLLNEGVAGYSTALLYSLRAIGDFLVQHYERDGISLIMGDHQPMRFMPGTETNDVPLHVLTRDPALHRRLLESGFQEGWMPDELRPSIRMSELRGLLLRVLSSESPAEEVGGD